MLVHVRATYVAGLTGPQIRTRLHQHGAKPTNEDAPGSTSTTPGILGIPRITPPDVDIALALALLKVYDEKVA